MEKTETSVFQSKDEVYMEHDGPQLNCCRTTVLPVL